MTNQRKSLKDRAVELSVNCLLMNGRDKGELDKLIGEVVVIRDFDFLTDSENNKEYVVFIIEEDDSKFFFGGTVLTDKLKELENDDYKEEIIKDGLPCLFGKKEPKDKKKQAYTTVEFYPETSTAKKKK